MQLPFLKMHGAGNDFVVIDRRGQTPLDPALAQRIADRRFGIGCDQVVVLEPSQKANVFMRLYNADGGEISACGNASRCVAMLIAQEKKAAHVTIETRAGILDAEISTTGITVMMGEPKWEWREIPLSESRNTLHLGLQEGALLDPVAVSIGNPHMVFFVRDADAVPLEKAGAKLEHDPLFPERANVSAVQILAPDHLKIRTWERGAGLTLACGSAACASVVAGVRRELCERNVRVDVPGGTLRIDWRAGDGNGKVFMTGPAEKVFEGTITL
jgi:diaminopimelate epimerase